MGDQVGSSTATKNKLRKRLYKFSLSALKARPVIDFHPNPLPLNVVGVITFHGNGKIGIINILYLTNYRVLNSETLASRYSIRI